MTENERYEIDKDLFYDIECVWDKRKPIGKIEDKETIIKLVNILNKQDKLINELTEVRNKHFQSLIHSEEVNEQLIKENKALKKENEELKRKHYNELMGEGVKIERLREENEKLNKENNELKIQLTVEEMDKEALEEQTAIDIEHYTKQNEKLQDQISMLKTTIARNEAYIHRLTSKGEWRK